MTLDQIANVAEIIGVIIVVITISYLTIQVRQNTQAIHSNTAQAAHESLTSGYSTLATDGDLNRLFRKGCNDPSALTDDELGQFFAFWAFTMYHTQNWLYQRSTKALDEELTNSWLVAVSPTLHSPGFKHFWKHRKYGFSAELKNYVEGVLAQPPIRPDYRVFGPSAE